MNFFLQIGKGRAVLLAYILVVANNGPFRNAMHNFQVLVNSTVCLQDKVVAALPPFVADQLKMKPESIKQYYLNLLTVIHLPELILNTDRYRPTVTAVSMGKTQ